MNSYEIAKALYAEAGVDTEAALAQLAKLPISVQCWQGDDVAGLEKAGAKLGDGLAATGNYPGKPRNGDELRADLDQAFSQIPGPLRLNLHACYAERGDSKADRNEYTVEFFSRWLDWAAGKNLGLDFNPSYFSHDRVKDGLTLTSPDAATRQFWIEHGIACRQIGEAFGKKLGSRSTVNVWIPDGSKDTPADRQAPRERLTESLNALFADQLDPQFVEDAVECKLFGIGSESFVVGSHEYYLGYAIQNRKVICLDSGHFHPTETLADKISSVLFYVPAILLHLSRGVRWDSDHVVILDDPTKAVAEEIARGNYFDRVRFGLDFFDASINRIAAWVTGTRAAKKALLLGLLQPHGKLKQFDADGDFTARLAWMENLKSLPHGLVWEEFCKRHDAPGDGQWLAAIQRYEREVQSKR